MGQHISFAAWIAWIPLLAACDTRQTPVDVDLTGGSDTLAIMTYNIFHDGERAAHGILPWVERRDAVVGAIRDGAPDVLGLQEAKVWQVAWLLEQMPEYSAVARGPYEDPGVEDAETVAILYLDERFELRESGHFWYSETPDEPGSFGSSAFGGMVEPRMATWVRLESRDGVVPNGFYVFNTHFIADERADDAEMGRFRSAEILVRRIAEREHADAHFIVTGDLNSTPGAWPLRFLLGSRCESGEDCADPVSAPEVQMIDVWESLHPGDTDTGTRCNAVSGGDGPRVDHLLIWDPAAEGGCGSGSCEPPEILSAEIVAFGPGCPSDHRPVSARIVLPGGA